MKRNCFFRLVWRVNGIIIFAAGLLAIGIALFAFYRIFRDTTRDRIVADIINIEVEADWQIGEFIDIPGQSVFIIPLRSDQTYERAYYSKSTNSVRNYLFVNTKTLDKRWLFNHTNYLIKRSSKLSLGGYNSESPVLAILYYLIKQDSNNDNLLSDKDLTTMALTKPDGSGYTEVLTDIEGSDGSKLISETELFLVYRERGISYSVVIDLNSFALKDKSQLPGMADNGAG